MVVRLRLMANATIAPLSEQSATNSSASSAVACAPPLLELPSRCFTATHTDLEHLWVELHDLDATPAQPHRQVLAVRGEGTTATHLTAARQLHHTQGLGKRACRRRRNGDKIHDSGDANMTAGCNKQRRPAAGVSHHFPGTLT